MTEQECSRARISRDKNFDGRFVFAVKTTGIFCRPSCPSPRAKEENVVYFESIFKALAKGFRPCLRCKPDISMEYGSDNPGSYTIVDSALTCIYDGFLNYQTLSQLAARFNITDRRLRQLFVERLGVPPVKIARYHKALFARKLLMQSGRRITDIAIASGFKSIRQFNYVFREVFGQSPSSMREEIENMNSSSELMPLLLKYRKPFHFKRMLSFLRDRALPGVEVVDADSYTRTFRTAETSGYFSVTDNPGISALELRICSGDIKCYMEIYNRVRRFFDLDTDFRPINRQLGSDEILAAGMEEGHVPRLPHAFDPFEFMVRAILGQQVTVKAATTIAGRLVSRAGKISPEHYPEGLDFYFPAAGEVSSMDLDGLGLTQIRQQTLKDAVEAVLSGRVSLSRQQGLEDFHRDFSALKGIGDWTVNYVAMRGLGLPDSFPAGDLGVIKALSSGGRKLSPKAIIARAENWKPYRSYATLCLWYSLSISE